MFLVITSAMEIVGRLKRTAHNGDEAKFIRYAEDLKTALRYRCGKMACHILLDALNAYF
jgi:hypothetical protein